MQNGPMRISEIFYSIQGEGSQYGLASIFVRFFGCDLSCAFCDEDLHKIVRYEWDAPTLLERLKKYPAKRITLTGGEPSLEDRNPLIELLRAEGYHVSVETNGYDFDNVETADWITYSPKDWEDIQYSAPYDEIKLVVNEGSDENKLLEIAERVTVPLFLQPEYEPINQGLANVHHCRDLILKHPESFRLSLQAHKLILIP